MNLKLIAPIALIILISVIAAIFLMNSSSNNASLTSTATNLQEGVASLNQTLETEEVISEIDKSLLSEDDSVEIGEMI